MTHRILTIECESNLTVVDTFGIDLKALFRELSRCGGDGQS